MTESQLKTIWDKLASVDDSDGRYDEKSYRGHTHIFSPETLEEFENWFNQEADRQEQETKESTFSLLTQRFVTVANPDQAVGSKDCYLGWLKAPKLTKAPKLATKTRLTTKEKRASKLRKNQSRFHKFLESGLSNAQADLAVNISAEWNTLEWDEIFDEGIVRLRCVPDEECAVWTGELTDEEVRYQGCWGIVAEYRNNAGHWQQADSVWGCAGYENPLSPYENPHVIDLMEIAIDAIRKER